MDRKIVEYLVMGKPHRWIKEQLGGVSSAQRRAALLTRKEWIEERLRAGWKAITVFEELRLSVTRSSFYKFLERHGLDRLSRDARVARVVPEIVHRPGDALILDWGKLCTIIDPASSVKRTLWVMIAVLGFSRYLCARVVWRNDVATTLAAIESIWQELGGVTSRLTSDNPKCFALTACRYEPVLNPAFERFATHYGFTIECPPPRDPQKKGRIERMVPYVRRLYEAHGEFISLDESQQYLSHKRCRRWPTRSRRARPRRFARMGMCASPIATTRWMSASSARTS